MCNFRDAFDFCRAVLQFCQDFRWRGRHQLSEHTLNWIYDQVSRANGSVSIYALEGAERVRGNKPDC